MTSESPQSKRPFLRRRRLLVSSAVLLLLCVAGASYVAWSITRTRDFDPPFDVEAFGYVEIPDGENAFTEYHQANWQYRPAATVEVIDNLELVLETGWSAASDDLKAYIESNQPALQIWKAGTNKSDALYHQPKSAVIDTLLPVTQNLREFARLAALEGRRFEHERRPAEAAPWYRAIFRSSRHSGMHGFIIERLVGIAMHRIAAERIVDWSSEANVDAALLRQARENAIADFEMTALPSTSVKLEYLMLHNTLKGSSVAKLSTWMQLTNPVDVTRAYLIEPDASRFVSAHVYGNWLRYIDRPRFERPNQRTYEPYLFDVPAEESADGQLSPDEIEAHFEQSVFAKMQVMHFDAFERAITREQATQAALIIALAAQEYYREKGTFPNQLVDLVGDYLDQVASDPFAVRSRQPMIYRRTETGAVVYSIGENGQDDGGQFDPKKGLPTGDFDVGFELLMPTVDPNEPSD